LVEGYAAEEDFGEGGEDEVAVGEDDAGYEDGEGDNGGDAGEDGYWQGDEAEKGH
jgi:hypothetical protein